MTQWPRLRFSLNNYIFILFLDKPYHTLHLEYMERVALDYFMTYLHLFFKLEEGYYL